MVLSAVDLGKVRSEIGEVARKILDHAFDQH